MFVATLVSSPEQRGLSGAMVDALRNAWGGGEAVWLSPDIAAEFPLADRPQNLWDVWQSLQAESVDLAVQSGEGRRKRLLIADMDSTMIQQECIDELAERAGVGARVAEITARAMDGQLDFEGALTERVSLLKGLPETVIQDVLESQITYTPGGRTLLATMKAHGARTLLVSGGFTGFATPIGAALGFDESRANVLLAQDDILTGQVAQPILGRDAKVDALHQTCTKMGIAPADALAVGDGANDLGMLGAAGMGVALHAKPSVAAECDLRVNHGDLTSLLYLQGYSDTEFVVA